MKKFTRNTLFILWIVMPAIFLFPGLKAQSYSPANDSLLSALTSQVNPDSVENYLLFLQEKGTRFLISPNRKTIAMEIADKFLALGAESARIDSFSCHTVIHMGGLQYDTVTWQYNVIGVISGILDSEDYFVMGAHYDDVVFPDGDPMVLAPGADDNASGVAALFETVRIFSQNDFMPMYSIEFVAFAAEELMYYGHSGSQAYVDSSMAQGKNLHLMINNDMIAYTASDDWKIWISNYEGNEVLTGIGEFVTENYTEITPVLRPKTDEAGADAYYFYEAGVPCIYFMEKDFNPYYHTENDLVENITTDYCVEAIKASIGVLVMAQDTILTDIEEPESSYLVRVYPNPTSGSLTIKAELPGHGPYSCYLRDINGRILEAFDLRGSAKIDIGKYSNGMYILQLVAGEQVMNHKVLLRKH